jgi:uncharacterized zinc-type alcohol dehydrogenase-like protein
MKVTAYAAQAANGTLEQFEYEAEPLGPDEVDVAVTHCGICHTDVGMVDNEWGISTYPVVAGHEIVGVVAGLGTNVDSTRLQVGQRVGVGAISGACMTCEWCLSGKHSVCADRVDTVMRGHLGGFASHVRASNWQFVYPIPVEISSEHAGPLLCAGATVFTPLLHYGVRPTDRVAVVGVGGLGHLALQFFDKWGCAVTAISSSRDKEAHARHFGARQFIATKDTNELQAATGSFDFILSTAPADLPWNDYVAALRPRGTLCVVGGPENSIAVDAFGLLTAEKAVVGGIPGSPVETAQMLEFAARHHVKPMVETFPMGDADRALQYVREGRARYRAVLVT